jgi:Ca-activated chloride channel family protein
MKKLLLVVLAVMLAAVMIFSACSSKAVTTTAGPAPVPATSAYHPPVTSAAPAPAPAPARPTTTAFPAPAPAPAPAGTRLPTYTPMPAPTITVTAPAATSQGLDSGRPQATSAPSSSNTIGLAAGGAKDIGNFRENIRNNYLPQPTDITYEGLFYDYYFDTGAAEPTNKLYSPSYSYAVTRDPFSHQTEYYLSVGLNSGLKESDFQRKTLNLVIVLDNSGSMNEQYTQYYYDQYGKQVDAYAEEGINRPSKMQSANEAVVSILDQLKSDDRFAIVTFNNAARLEKSMDYVSRTDMWNVEDDVRNITPGGSTNLAAGLEMASKQFNRLSGMDSYEYENRIIVLTDAQPNTGDFSSGGLESAVQSNSARRVYTTFIGVGVDFNSDLVEQITKIKGANYYSVHSPRQFRQRVEEEFDYMVTPLVFDLSLSFESRGWRIEKVFGSPEADEATGNLMKINTLFASKSEGGETRGGLVLLKLKKTSSASNTPVYLRTSYEDRNGRTDSDEQLIYLETAQPEYFDNTGIRKGVLLSRYAALLKNWMIDERQHISYSRPWTPCITEDSGIIIPVENISQWERQSLALTVSGSYDRIFSDFADYFNSEMKAIGDNDLRQEMDILNMLSRY